MPTEIIVIVPEILTTTVVNGQASWQPADDTKWHTISQWVEADPSTASQSQTWTQTVTQLPVPSGAVSDSSAPPDSVSTTLASTVTLAPSLASSSAPTSTQPVTTSASTDSSTTSLPSTSSTAAQESNSMAPNSLSANKSSTSSGLSSPAAIAGWVLFALALTGTIALLVFWLIRRRRKRQARRGVLDGEKADLVSGGGRGRFSAVPKEVHDEDDEYENVYGYQDPFAVSPPASPRPFLGAAPGGGYYRPTAQHDDLPEIAPLSFVRKPQQLFVSTGAPPNQPHPEDSQREHLSNSNGASLRRHQTNSTASLYSQASAYPGEGSLRSRDNTISPSSGGAAFTPILDTIESRGTTPVSMGNTLLHTRFSISSSQAPFSDANSDLDQTTIGGRTKTSFTASTGPGAGGSLSSSTRAVVSHHGEPEDSVPPVPPIPERLRAGSMPLAPHPSLAASPSAQPQISQSLLRSYEQSALEKRAAERARVRAQAEVLMYPDVSRHAGSGSGALLGGERRPREDEEDGLKRDNTVAISTLLKKRQQEGGSPPRRTATKVSRIERRDSLERSVDSPL